MNWKRNFRSRSVTVTVLCLIAFISLGLTDCSTTSTQAGPTATPKATPIPGVTFDFETGVQNWGTSEGQYKLARVDVTTQHARSGKQALEVTTSLLGGKNSAYTPDKEVYRHTETVVYFNKTILNGFSSPGPYNLEGKQISCFVYLPHGLETTFIRIFVKDTKYANDFSKVVDINSSNIDKWLQLTFVVGSDPNDADTNFDASKVNALGVRIETPDSAMLSYTGSFYIDDCTIEHP